MKIVMLSQHGCMRVMKMALPLISKGYEVHLIVNKMTQYSEYFKTVSVFQDADQLYEAVRMHSDADIFHAHNEPSWFVTVVKEIFPDKPVILDVHDSHLLRRSQEELDEKKDFELYRVSVDERNNTQLADGIVYVSKRMEKIVGETFKLDQPSIMLPSLVPERFYRIDFLRWFGGLVYEGRIDIPDELEKQWDFFQYANYLDLAKECDKIGIDFHIYTPRKNATVRQMYEQVCFLHDPVGISKLIKAIGGHDWGLVGNSKPYEEWKNALPNKYFEYMAACLPIVSINADECAEINDEYGFGINVNSMEELAERWAEHRECRKNVIKYRREFTMEAHLPKLEKLYKELT